MEGLEGKTATCAGEASKRTGENIRAGLEPSRLTVMVQPKHLKKNLRPKSKTSFSNYCKP
jgi:hypothetical protein